MVEGTQAESPPVPPPEPAASIRPLRAPSRRWLVLGVVLVVAVVVVASILVVGPSAPWQEAVLAQGRTFLDIPLATLFTAPSLPNQTVNTSVRVSYSSGFWINSSSAVPPSFIFYQWFMSSGTALPVKFVLGFSWPSDPTSWFEEGPNALDYLPAGPLPSRASGQPASYVNGSLEGTNRQGVFVTKWAMDYTVRKMGVLEGLTPTSYLEVDYTMSVLDPGSVYSIASTNVSAPSSADVVATSGSVSVAPGVPWSLDGNGYSIDSRSPFTNYQPFHYNDTQIRLDAGSEGTLEVQLHSTSWWNAVCAHMSQCWPTAGYTLDLSFSNQTTWFQVYIDRRFGSLLIQYVPPPAP